MPGRRNREGACNTHSNGGRIYAFYYERKHPAAQKDRLSEKQHFTGNINFEFKSYVDEQSKITGCINLRIDLSVGWFVRLKCINSRVQSFSNVERFAFGKVEMGFPLPAPFKSCGKGFLNSSRFLSRVEVVFFKYSLQLSFVEFT